MKVRLFISVCAGVLLCTELLLAQIEQTGFKPVHATVLRDKVNVRAGQGLNFEIIDQLNKGAKVVVIGHEYNWHKIKLPQQARCFVDRQYIDGRVVKVEKLRVRAGKGINFNILGVLRKGEVVEVLAEDGNWLKISPPDNCSGWIKKGFLQLAKGEFTPKPSLISAPQETIRVQGVIKEMGRLFKRPGTHKLVKGRKMLYYLKSENIDLNLYVHQKVEVAGRPQTLKRSRYSVLLVEKIITK